ncbi:multicopper oxidase domain-containing protein [Kitasatospora fiedleri]|uniref:multicopper oxidase domain-containing protein n=1 Tax=Kitasatospora fiedleri TaxID=2991545 RepID=UPI00249B1AE8|nr:multicopper oxidase domain-containing protein [Kitasatospora fiedleri]
MLEQVLDVRFAGIDVPGHGRITTRAYNGALPGPTLRVRAGDTLLLTHVNGLPPNPAAPGTGDARAHGARMPHRPNSFNLHTHGMHVSPSGHADNVLREFAPRAAEGDPEPRYTSVVHVPADHPAGTYWYHPHLHGSTAEQLAGAWRG